MATSTQTRRRRSQGLQSGSHGNLADVPSSCKAPEGWRSPRRFADFRNHRVTRSVLECGGPPPLFPQTYVAYLFDRFVDGFASILPEISKNLGDSSLSLFVTSHSCKIDHPLQQPLNSVNCDVCALADMTPSCRPEERRAFNELVQPLLARLARLYSGGLACALPKLCQLQSSGLWRGRA